MAKKKAPARKSTRKGAAEKTSAVSKTTSKTAATRKSSTKHASQKKTASKTPKGSTRKTAASRETTAAADRSHDVFISYKYSTPSGSKTYDADVARQVYDALRERGVAVFYSAESTIAQGAGNFSSAIESALDASRVLVLVGSCAEHIQSPYVRAEWDAFLNDIRSGHKTQGELFVLNCGTLEPRQMPLFLRCHQMFALDNLDALVNSVVNALPAPPALGDVVATCLRFKDERSDKIYLLTVTAAPNGSFTVTSHWGRRKSERLNSQVKATDVADMSAANELVKQLEKKKKRTGYRKARWNRVLSAQARQALGAALHLTTSVEK